MMIAGCINQSKRVFEKYDEVLYGQAPESLIEDAHRAIRELLISPEGKSFLSKVDSLEEDDRTMCDSLIKRIIAAVPPIVPVTLRNKALDGSYFRTALHMLGAAELLFSQYEADVRKLANPAGVVGLCSYMHAELERCALYNDELKPLKDFMRDMTSQYQTSLGLGKSFSNDSSTRKNRNRNRYTRGQSYVRPNQFVGRGLGRGLQMARTSFGIGTGDIANTDASPLRGRGRGLCYGFQAGTCRRGNTCRFLHLSQ